MNTIQNLIQSIKQVLIGSDSKVVDLVDKSPSESRYFKSITLRITMTQMIRPQQTDHRGYAFGGEILAWV
jgi:hypothetical protein